MKNESNVLRRMLESVYPILDYYVVVDTGSTDDSKKIVKDFFDSKGIPGEIHDHPFVDFEDARNFALEKLKGKADFGFWTDCDEQLIIKEGFDLNQFKNYLSKFDLVHTFVNSGPSKYARRNFFKISKKFVWQGKVHELLMCEEEITVANYDKLEILVTNDGNSWSQGTRKKYLKHATILEREVKKTNKPRDIFYLAQSYRDAQENAKSVEWYRKRVNRTDGFSEERYYSQLMIGVLYERLKKPFGETLAEYLKCSEIDKERAEHLLNAIILLQANGLWQTAYTLSKSAVEKYHGKIPNRLLFLHRDCYAFQLMNCHKINVSTTGNTETLSETYDRLCSTVSDINEHLPVLKKYAEKYQSITEMGVRYGVSSYAFLAGNPKKLTSYDINHNDCVSKIEKFSKQNGTEYKFIQGDVLKLEIEPTDVLFIDTLHCYNQLKEELRLHAGKANHAIIFHDTSTFGYKDEIDQGSPTQGLRQAIEEFLVVSESWTISKVYENNNGLTILEKHSEGERVIKFSKPKPIEIDVCIISYAKNDELREITERGIESLIASEDNIQFNIFVVESNKNVSYNKYPHTKTIYTDLPFGYNRYLNIARKQGSAPYVVLCNNDLTYEKNWASEILRAMSIDNSILSASPLCPQIQSYNNFKEYLIWYGYEVRNQLAGWCIFQQRKIYDQIENLDESFTFWYCDGDYSMELQKRNIRHCLVSTSFVNHHSNILGKTADTFSEEDKEKLKSNEVFNVKWELTPTM